MTQLVDETVVLKALHQIFPDIRLMRREGISLRRICELAAAELFVLKKDNETIRLALKMFYDLGDDILR